MTCQCRYSPIVAVIGRIHSHTDKFIAILSL
jgi:hypothetical protein